jgi:hypothetical protein
MDKTQEYDGSKDPGVDIDSFAREALKRLDVRYNYLTNELKRQSSIITGFVASDKEKNEAFARVKDLEMYLYETEEMQFFLECASPVLEYERKLDHKDFDPSILEKYK